MPIPMPIPMNGFMREWEARRSVRSCKVAFWDTGGTGIAFGSKAVHNPVGEVVSSMTVRAVTSCSMLLQVQTRG